MASLLRARRSASSPVRRPCSSTAIVSILAPAALMPVRAGCVAIHRGRRTMVWQTRVTSEDNKLLAIVTQTQMVLPGEPRK